MSLIGVIALGSQKLLPLFQSSYVRFTYIKGKISSINKVIYYLSLTKSYSEKTKSSRINLERIELQGVKFNYLSNKYSIFNGVDLLFNSESLGLVGKTGSGKVH